MKLSVPVGSGKGMWSWLQPYAGVSNRDGDPTTGEKRYNALDVGRMVRVSGFFLCYL